MADVRALLAAERQSRRISHPHLSYTKSGMLICTICSLNVKSEALWDGHLRSANHRKNAQSAQENTGKGLKRKIEDVEEPQSTSDWAEADGRKKPKSQPASIPEEGGDEESDPDRSSRPEPKTSEEPIIAPSTIHNPAVAPSDTQNPNGTTADPPVDEDEWVAFEREVAPLMDVKLNYSAVTISAAPVSAAQILEQANEDKRRRLDAEAEDEKEEEERRLEEEFDVQEEFEERLRKLREKRDALRTAVKVGADTGQSSSVSGQLSTEQGRTQEARDVNGNDEDDGDEDEGDDWYL